MKWSETFSYLARKRLSPCRWPTGSPLRSRIVLREGILATSSLSKMMLALEL